MAIDLSTYGGEQREAGYEGGLIDLNPATITNLTNDGNATIGFGRAVARSSADDTCKAPAADTDKIIGISVRHVTFAGPGLYNKNVTVPVLREGFIYAIATEATARGDGVISRTAQGGTLGSTTGGAAGAGRVAVPGATWETTTPAGGLGVVRIN
ncbi:MAG: hypothetical protein LBU45_09270 [Azoarcus sp.]|jgi:hypothetical protein|nr:hypothetical protein [Azoarcus sp.]